MKHFILLCTSIVFYFWSFATDLLVVGQDTFYLKTFPLEALNLTNRPFNLSKEDANVSGSYPGYQAVWQLVDGKLYLEKILSDAGKAEDIVLLFQNNNIKIQRKNNLILADWLSITFYAMEPFDPTNNSKVFLAGSYNKTVIPSKILLRIANGIVNVNKLLTDYR